MTTAMMSPRPNTEDRRDDRRSHDEIAEDRIARECEAATMALLRERARRAAA